MRTTIWAAAAVTVGVLGLDGCGSGSGSGSDSTAAQATTTSESASPASDAVLSTADSSLGQIVVDGKGHTAYVFDEDTPDAGTSSCSGQCLQLWPAVTADSENPAVDGVDGEVGTITRDDGRLQVTLDGMPLYTYAPDAQAGDVTGQGVGGVWWVVAPDGARITSKASTASPTTVTPTY